MLYFYLFFISIYRNSHLKSRESRAINYRYL
nr:MAG TPA: hypothetical protein [Caudoviricetes sp.]